MSESHDKLETIFAAALELPGEEQQAFIAQACGQDAELRQRVERLLRNLSRAGNFLAQEGTDASGPGSPAHEKPGDWIGRYKLLEQIGEGGGGVVFLAEQNEPLHRRVALKLQFLK